MVFPAGNRLLAKQAAQKPEGQVRLPANALKNWTKIPDNMAKPVSSGPIQMRFSLGASVQLAGPGDDGHAIVS